MATDVYAQVQHHFKGYARVNLDHVEFDSGRDLDDRNVKRLLGIFSLQGCRREDPTHAIPVVVEKKDLVAALAHENSHLSVLHQSSVEAQLLFFTANVELTCFHGKHRIYAARKFLRPSDQWWTVRIFDSGKEKKDLLRGFLTAAIRSSSTRTRTSSIRVPKFAKVFGWRHFQVSCRC